ncbi:MAG: hypothetical protein HY313_10345 [Acidobacteria bacterium]|nr:hypothetical protein [Acidobacteriota bacterium]
MSHNYWPRQVRRRYPDLVTAVVNGIAEWEANAGELYDEMYGHFAFDQYSDHIEYLLVEGYQDPVLALSLQNHPDKTLLYTGGGIVPRQLLDIRGVRFLHIHPGYLPHVRGADGLLWSTLVRGRPGATAFFLDKGIDAGDVVFAWEVAPLRIAVTSRNRPDDQTLYRTLFGFVDPVLRMRTLLRLLSDCSDPALFAGRAQDLSVGITYHFMVDELRAVALKKIFADGA